MKRWHDPSVSWDDRVRVTERLKVEFAKRANTQSAPGIGGIIRRMFAIIDFLEGKPSFSSHWEQSARGALRAEGFEVPE